MGHRGRHSRRRRPRREPVSDQRDWASLPAPALDLLAGRMSSLSDYISFSHVCRPWYRVAKTTESSYISSLTTPRLLVPARSKFSLVNIVTNRVHDLQLDLPEKRYCGSTNGWLFYVDHVEGRYGVTLIKPFDWLGGATQEKRSIIRLPPLPPLAEVFPETFSGGDPACNTCPDHHLFKATLSGEPKMSGQDCTFVVLHEFFRALAFCRRERGAYEWRWSAWTYVKGDLSGDEAVLMGKQLLVVDTDGDIFSVNIDGTPPFPLRLAQGPADKSSKLVNKFYLADVKDKGIVMVQRIYDDERRTRAFRVFLLTSDGNDWKLIGIDNLGDFALFIGGNSSVAVASSVDGCLANHIYFLQDWNGILGEDAWSEDYGAYNIAYHLISKSPFRDAKYLVEESRLPPIWLVPSLSIF